MNTKPITLNAETAVTKAIDQLLANKQSSAAVIDISGRLVGFFSAHDVMVELWCQDYIPAQKQKVVDLMSLDVVSIEANDKLVDVAEFMCIDKEKLFPTTNINCATNVTSLSLEERAKSIKINKPQALPVLDNGKFVGMVTRLEMLKAMRDIYGKPADASQEKA